MTQCVWPDEMNMYLKAINGRELFGEKNIAWIEFLKKLDWNKIITFSFLYFFR